MVLGVGLGGWSGGWSIVGAAMVEAAMVEAAMVGAGYGWGRDLS